MIEKSATPVAVPIYELPAPTSTASFDTECNPFHEENDVTILCEAVFNNHNWASGGSQTLFGLGTGWYFRVGNSGSGNAYLSGEKTASDTHYYTALICNATNDTDNHKITSMLARQDGSVTWKCAVRYRRSDKLIQGIPQGMSPSQTTRWYNLDNYLYSETTTLKLNMGTSQSTINIFKVYDSFLSDSEVSAFLGGN